MPGIYRLLSNICRDERTGALCKVQIETRGQYGKIFFATAVPEMPNMEYFYWEPIAQYLIEHGADSNKRGWEPSASITIELSAPDEISSEASASSDTEF